MTNTLKLEECIVSNIITRTPPPISFLDLFVTEDCNLCCPYCFIHGKTPRYLNMRTGRRAIDFLIEQSRDLNKISVLFMGGEPLLNYSVIAKLVIYARKRALECNKKVSFNITTNGTLIDSMMMRFFKQHNVSVLLSMDGGRHTQDLKRRFKSGGGTYDVVCERMSLIKSYMPWIGIRMTPTPETVNNLYNDCFELFKLGANQFIIGPATGILWPKESLSEYTRQMKKVARWYVRTKLNNGYVRINQFGVEPAEEIIGGKRNIWGCGAGRGRISVSVVGDIQGCAKIQGLNNLCGITKFGDIWSGFSNSLARYYFTGNYVNYRAICMKCDLVDYCTGGCPSVNYEATGSIFMPDPVECKFTKISLMLKQYVFSLFENNI